MILTFSKYHGTGNDFILVDNRELNWNPVAKEVSFLCDRRMGVGADGLILLGRSTEAAFMMRYFNSDGGESTMCGNGGRCIAAFANSLGIKAEIFKAVDGLHEAQILESSDNVSLVKLKMNDVIYPENISEEGFFINTGSPHMVTFTDDPQKIDIINEGRKIRYNKILFPEGTNVNFVKISGARLFVRTYERGVEDETLSCGTGVTASALAAALISGNERTYYDVETKGGNLKVSFSKAENRFENVWLEGSATFVYNASINL